MGTACPLRFGEPSAENGRSQKVYFKKSCHYRAGASFSIQEPPRNPARTELNVMTQIFCSIPDAGFRLGVGRTKTYDLIATKKLKLVKIGGRSLVEVASIDKLAETLLKEAVR